MNSRKDFGSSDIEKYHMTLNRLSVSNETVVADGHGKSNTFNQLKWAT